MVIKGDDLSEGKPVKPDFFRYDNKPFRQKHFYVTVVLCTELDPSDQYFEVDENILIFQNT